jgi:hypothetical protein
VALKKSYLKELNKLFHEESKSMSAKFNLFFIKFRALKGKSTQGTLLSSRYSCIGNTEQYQEGALHSMKSSSEIPISQVLSII